MTFGSAFLGIVLACFAWAVIEVLKRR